MNAMQNSRFKIKDKNQLLKSTKILDHILVISQQVRETRERVHYGLYSPDGRCFGEWLHCFSIHMLHIFRLIWQFFTIALGVD